MKISVLMENNSEKPELTAEHGLSLLIETKRHTILFDTGQTGAFADNAVKMGIDLKKVDMAVLSHGHYDHGGGLERFFTINDTAKVYVSQFAFLPYYHGSERYIGLDPALNRRDRLIFTDDEMKIDENLSLYSCNRKKTVVPIESYGLTACLNGEFRDDRFRHEQYLLIEEDGKKVLISGCSHKGIINIVNWFQPDVLVGGFHFMKLDPEVTEDRKKLISQAEELLKYPTKYYTGHCTGAAQYDLIREKMGDRLDSIHAGKVLVI